MPLRLVQIVPYPILPASSGGKVRIVQLARALCGLGIELTIISPFHFTQRRVLARREPFTLRQIPYAPFVLPYLVVDRPFPYGALVSFHPGYRALLPISLASFDICQIDHPAFVDLARDVPRSVPIVYGSQNVEFDYVSAESRPGVVRRLAGGRVRALEAELIDRSAHVFACTETDRRRFHELYGVSPDRTSVLPNGIDVKAIDRERARREGIAGARTASSASARRAIFAGSDVEHNRAAVRAILTGIAPDLEGEVDFIIMGPCARSVSGRPPPNVRLVPDGDVADFAGTGAVGLNPVVAGSGSSMKLLHYLACDLPVISTPFGLRGFQDLSRWVVTAELSEFGDALRRVPPPPHGHREHLAAYEWKAVAQRASAVYDALLGRSPHSGGADSSRARNREP